MLNMMLKHEILKGIQDYVKIDEPGSYKLMKSHIKGASARSFHHRVQDIFKIKRCSLNQMGTAIHCSSQYST